MKEISNQTLAFLLVLAVIVSLGGTFFSLQRLDKLVRGGLPITGFSGVNTTTGAVNLSISDVTEINFTVANLTWGSGSVAGDSTNCSLSTYTGATNLGCTGFAEMGGTPLTIGNIGNNNVILNLTFAHDADAFIGGVASINSYKFRPSNNSAAPGCDGVMNFTSGMEVISGSHNNTICNNFTFVTGKDKINIDINLTIPYDSKRGILSTSITATAETV